MREKEEMLVKSNERVDDEQRVKREPESMCGANVLAMRVVD